MNFRNFTMTLLATFFFITFAQAQTPPARPPQFVLLSFDGSLNLAVWKKIRGFSQEQKAKGQNVNFTFFASGVYFLHPKNSSFYLGPKHAPGKSDIGWGVSPEDIGSRVDQVNLAFQEGHEIGSHGNGHFDGSTWSHSEWSSEFSQFEKFIFDVFSINKIDPNREVANGWLMNKDNMKGFRAPLLAVSPGLWTTLSDYRFSYDCSKVDVNTYWPKKSQQGIWNFPLAMLKIAGSGKKTLSMDYNFYVSQSGGSPNPAQKEVFQKQMFDTYLAWFQQNYNGNRAPMNIGHHFSMWNGGAYFEALTQFADKVCGLPEVKCVTYTEYVNWLESLTPTILARYGEGKFEKPATPVALSKFSASTVSFQFLTKEDLNNRALKGDLPEAHFDERFE